MFNTHCGYLRHATFEFGFYVPCGSSVLSVLMFFICGGLRSPVRSPSAGDEADPRVCERRLVAFDLTVTGVM